MAFGLLLYINIGPILSWLLSEGFSYPYSLKELFNFVFSMARGEPSHLICVSRELKKYTFSMCTASYL